MSRRLRRKPRPATRFRPRVAPLEDRLLLAVDVLTYHNDNARDGLNPNETILTPSDVNANTFGLLFVDNTDGQVYAQPLYMSGVTIPGQGTHNVLYVATENDSVYAFDADDGAILWHDGPSGTPTTLLPAGEVPSDGRNSVLAPEIGITATPVIDPSTGTIYVVTASMVVSGDTTTYVDRVLGLDVATGAIKMESMPIDQSITYPGTGPGSDGTDVSFDPAHYLERDALLLEDGVVYTSWSSHDDTPPYTGWMIGFNASDLSLATILNVDPNGVPTSGDLPDGSGNTFWNSGDGPAADAAGNIYNISGNGPFDTNLDANGFPQSGDYGDSFLKFTADGGLSVSDYFTPYNQQDMAATDLDLGSSGIMLLPDMVDGNGVTQQLAIGSGKDGNIYVVNRDDMGKFNAADNSNIYQEVVGGVGGDGEYGSPAYFNGQVYFGGVNANLDAYQFVNAQLQPTPTSQSPETFSYPGTTPSISSNGTSDGIVWTVQAWSYGLQEILFAYDASDLSHEPLQQHRHPELARSVRAGASVRHADDRQRQGLRRHDDRGRRVRAPADGGDPGVVGPRGGRRHDRGAERPRRRPQLRRDGADLLLGRRRRAAGRAGPLLQRRRHQHRAGRHRHLRTGGHLHAGGDDRRPARPDRHQRRDRHRRPGADGHRRGAGRRHRRRHPGARRHGAGPVRRPAGGAADVHLVDRPRRGGRHGRRDRDVHRPGGGDRRRHGPGFERHGQRHRLGDRRGAADRRGAGVVGPRGGRRHDRGAERPGRRPQLRRDGADLLLGRRRRAAGAPAPSFSDGGTNTAQDVTVTFAQAGTYTLEATIADPLGLTATSDVTVTVDQALTAIAVAPAAAAVADGATEAFVATALDQFGAPLASQPAFTWSVDPGGVGGAVDATGTYTAPATGAGADTVRAAVGTVSGTASVSVTGSGPMIVTPASSDPAEVAGTTAALSVLVPTPTTTRRR